MDEGSAQFDTRGRRAYALKRYARDSGRIDLNAWREVEYVQQDVLALPEPAYAFGTGDQWYEVTHI